MARIAGPLLVAGGVVTELMVLRRPRASRLGWLAAGARRRRRARRPSRVAAGACGRGCARWRSPRRSASCCWRPPPGRCRRSATPTSGTFPAGGPASAGRHRAAAGGGPGGRAAAAPGRRGRRGAARRGRRARPPARPPGAAGRRRACSAATRQSLTAGARLRQGRTAAGRSPCPASPAPRGRDHRPGADVAGHRRLLRPREPGQRRLAGRRRRVGPGPLGAGRRQRRRCPGTGGPARPRSWPPSRRVGTRGQLGQRALRPAGQGPPRCARRPPEPWADLRSPPSRAPAADGACGDRARSRTRSPVDGPVVVLVVLAAAVCLASILVQVSPAASEVLVLLASAATLGAVALLVLERRRGGAGAAAALERGAATGRSWSRCPTPPCSSSTPTCASSASPGPALGLLGLAHGRDRRPAPARDPPARARRALRGALRRHVARRAPDLRAPRAARPGGARDRPLPPARRRRADHRRLHRRPRRHRAPPPRAGGRDPERDARVGREGHPDALARPRHRGAPGPVRRGARAGRARPPRPCGTSPPTATCVEPLTLGAEAPAFPLSTAEDGDGARVAQRTGPPGVPGRRRRRTGAWTPPGRLAAGRLGVLRPVCDDDEVKAVLALTWPEPQAELRHPLGRLLGLVADEAAVAPRARRARRARWSARPRPTR